MESDSDSDTSEISLGPEALNEADEENEGQQRKDNKKPKKPNGAQRKVKQQKHKRKSQGKQRVAEARELKVKRNNHAKKGLQNRKRPRMRNNGTSDVVPRRGKRKVQQGKRGEPARKMLVSLRRQPKRKCKREVVPELSVSYPTTSAHRFEARSYGKGDAQKRKQKHPNKKMLKRGKPKRKFKRGGIEKLCSSSAAYSDAHYDFPMDEEGNFHDPCDLPSFGQLDEENIHLGGRVSEAALFEASSHHDMSNIGEHHDLQGQPSANFLVTDGNHSTTSQERCTSGTCQNMANLAEKTTGETETQVEEKTAEMSRNTSKSVSVASDTVRPETAGEQPAQHIKTSEANNGDQNANVPQSINASCNLNDDEMLERWTASLKNRRSIWTVAQVNTEPVPEPEPIGDGHNNAGADDIDLAGAFIERDLGINMDIIFNVLAVHANNMGDINANEPELALDVEEGDFMNPDALERDNGPENAHNNENGNIHNENANADHISDVINPDARNSANIVHSPEGDMNSGDESGVANESSVLSAGNSEELEENTENSGGGGGQDIGK